MLKLHQTDQLEISRLLLLPLDASLRALEMSQSLHSTYEAWQWCFGAASPCEGMKNHTYALVPRLKISLTSDFELVGGQQLPMFKNQALSSQVRDTIPSPSKHLILSLCPDWLCPLDHAQQPRNLSLRCIEPECRGRPDDRHWQLKVDLSRKSRHGDSWTLELHGKNLSKGHYLMYINIKDTSLPLKTDIKNNTS